MVAPLFEGRPRIVPVQQEFDHPGFHHLWFLLEQCTRSVVQLVLVREEAPPG